MTNGVSPRVSFQIVQLEADHVEALAGIVRINDAAIAHMMVADVTNWLRNDRPDGESYFTALIDNQPVGMTGFQRDPWGVQDVAWLVWLYIHPNWKRQGIAKALFTHAQDLLRNMKYRKVYLDVGNEEDHREAIAFHLKDGFTREGHLRGFWNDDQDFIIFSKRL